MQPASLQDRLDQIRRVTADPPAVHEGAPDGVWATSAGCYELIARLFPASGVTLETGLGVSTVLFAMWARRHTCVVGSGDQVDKIRRYADERGLDLSNVRFEVGTSDCVLPALDLEPLDLYLIDGGHGYPQPVIDWYYGGRHLVPGGVVVVDDIQLPSVHDYLVTFLDADPRWEGVGGDHKWRAFKKVGDFQLMEEWSDQPFLGGRRLPPVTRAKIAIRRQLDRLSGRSSTHHHRNPQVDPNER